MKQRVWRVEVSSRVDLIDGEAFTGGSGVPPLRQKGSFPCYEKRRDAASPSHDAGRSRDAKFNFYREIARYPLFAEIGRGAFTHLVIDSWEAGKQDWTDDFAEKFAARCGYDCRPWLPALTGRTVVKGRLVAAA